MTESQRRVAIVNAAGSYVGPALCRLLAGRGHDLVVGDPAPGLVGELEALGASVVTVAGGSDLADPDAAPRLVDAAVTRFGRIDAAAGTSGAIVTGRFVNSSPEDLAKVVRGCLEAPYRFLRAVVPVMVAQEEGQVLVITSASAARPTPGAPLYSAARAGATMLAKNVASEVARTGVQVNAVGTNFMDFPEFLAANRVTDDGVPCEGGGHGPPAVASARSRSSPPSACRSSTAPAASRRASSSPTPEDGRDRRRPDAGAAASTRCSGAWRTMHSLYYQAVDSMDLEHVNHFERDGVLPIAFSLFHYTNMQDASFMCITGDRADLERRVAVDRCRWRSTTTASTAPSTR